MSANGSHRVTSGNVIWRVTLQPTERIDEPWITWNLSERPQMRQEFFVNGQVYRVASWSKLHV